jgi:hypothetical protein
VKRRYEHWAKVRHPQKKTRKLTEKLQEESKPPTFAFAVARREFELDSKHLDDDFERLGARAW